MCVCGGGGGGRGPPAYKKAQYLDKKKNFCKRYIFVCVCVWGGGGVIKDFETKTFVLHKIKN